MLRKLHIQNYAIIEEIDIEFSYKLNIITGETGAGKSIVMGALSLILGQRAESSALFNRELKCIVEGVFDTENRKDILDFLKRNDLDAEDELVIRREISSNGKSRAFVNDTPVNLEQLRLLSTMMVDLHQQFDNLELGQSDFQRDVLDALGGQSVLVQHYQEVYQQWQQNSKKLGDLKAQKNQFMASYDYHKFLFDELEEVALKENELETLDKELKLLTHSEGIKGTLSKLSDEMQQGDQPLVQQLKSMCHQLQGYTSYHLQLPGLLQRLQSTQIELADIAQELESLNDHIQYDPLRIEQINERISAGYKLLKKHGLQYTNDLLALKTQLSGKLEAVLNLDDSILRAETQAAQFYKQAMELAVILSANRQKQIKVLEQKVNKLLFQVGMPNAKLKVTQQSLESIGLPPLNEFGIDKIEFLFDANKSNRFEPIRKVASGGELSRLMLCIKSLVAQSLDLPTLIFDEIDTGISGEAARQVGIIMKELATARQVISITHQPQIAGKADAHFFVFKEIQGNALKTNIRLLSREERITTIAKMLSGEKPTAAALENAREMVMN